MNARHA
jgi:hypothetical protein